MYLSDITLEEILIGGIVIVLILMFVFGLSALSKSRKRMEACNRSIDKLGDKVNTIGSILDDKLDKLEKQEVIVQQVPVPMPMAAPVQIPEEEDPAEPALTEEELVYAKATGQIPVVPEEPEDDIEFGQDEISFDDMDVFGEYTQDDVEAAASIDSFDDIDDIEIKDFSDLMDIDDSGVEELFLETVTEDESAEQLEEPIQPQAVSAASEIPPASASNEVPAFVEMPPEESARKPRLRKVPANKHLRKVGKSQVDEAPLQPVYKEPVYEEPAYEEPIYEEPSYVSPFKKHQGYDIGRSGKRYTVTELETLIRE